MQNSFENFLRNIFLSEAEYPDMESKRAAALTPKETYPDMESKRAKATDEIKRKKAQTEDEENAKSKEEAPGGFTTQTVVSGIEPSKKLGQLVSLKKPFQMRESFIREQVFKTLFMK